MLALPHFKCAWMETQGMDHSAMSYVTLGSLAPDDTDALEEACENGALEDCQDALCFMQFRRRR